MNKTPKAPLSEKEIALISTVVSLVTGKDPPDPHEVLRKYLSVVEKVKADRQHPDWRFSG